MRTAFDRIFRKNLLIVLLILVLFVGEKVQSVRRLDLSYASQPLLDTLIAQSADMSEEELDSWLLSLTEESTGAEENTLKQAKSELMSSIANRDEVNQLISFARNGEGALPVILPVNYTQLLDFYAGLEEPQIINELPLDRYFFLQSGNLVPVLALCLTVIYWSMHYESEMYKYTRTVKRGEAYARSYRLILLGISLCLLTVNELYDLSRSGLLKQTSLWAVSVQSYRTFKGSQIDCNMFQIFLLMWISKLFGIWLMTIIGERVASAKKNLKDAAMFAFFVMMALLFLGKALTAVSLSSTVQIGQVNWSEIISAAKIVLPLGIPSVVLGVAVTVLVPIGCGLLKRKR